jgi:hypothetical protein
LSNRSRFSPEIYPARGFSSVYRPLKRAYAQRCNIVTQIKGRTNERTCPPQDHHPSTPPSSTLHPHPSLPLISSQQATPSNTEHTHTKPQPRTLPHPSLPQPGAKRGGGGHMTASVVPAEAKLIRSNKRFVFHRAFSWTVRFIPNT